MMSKQGKSLKRSEPESDLCFAGDPVPITEAVCRWPLRYRSSKARMDSPKNADDKKMVQAKRHYLEAKVDGVKFKLGDDVYVTSVPSVPLYIGKIIELFEAINGTPYFRARWFYYPQDTMIEGLSKEVQSNRVFLSDDEDDNPLTCIWSAVKIAKVPLKINPEDRIIPKCDFYYDMKYELSHRTFSSINDDCEGSSTMSSEGSSNYLKTQKKEKFLLDLYSGCGAMSTGLCAGASISGVNLITKWAVDITAPACESLMLNHPETEVRNEAAEDFLMLLKDWFKLCQKYSLIPSAGPLEPDSDFEEDDEDELDDADVDNHRPEIPPKEFEVGEFLAICYGDPKGIGKSALHLKVRWKGYCPEEDTWEPFDGLTKCKDKLREFVTKGFQTNLLPLPGDVHFVCGGPPCQGVSGFNRHINKDEPLKDDKNKQLMVFMDIIDFLKPDYVLMENVVDLLRFAEGYLARYAVARLVTMNYQTRLGMMVAGAYGVPQVRNRVFLWGALPNVKLPPYPLPTHNVLNKSLKCKEFEDIQVGQSHKNTNLGKALDLGEALSDLPEVTNIEVDDVMNYETGRPNQSDFQKYISLARNESIIPKVGGDASDSRMLFDHQPLDLNDDDLERVRQIPKKKGACFRDLKGVLVINNRVKFDPTIKRPKLKSGRYLVPRYAMKYKKGSSTKPFGRLSWDEIIKTVVTRAEPHNQVVIHPEQHRVMSVRENARLQGFPDFFKLCGTIKEKYIQVGNAVAVPIGVALGYAYGMATQGLCEDKPVITLPFKYPQCMERKSSEEQSI